MNKLIGPWGVWAFLFMVISAPVEANVLAVIDSGTDLKHEAIAPYRWTNLVEVPGNNRDEDHNGYPDDVDGWNFAESNNEVIDYSYLGILNDDIRKFFAIQAKMLRGEASNEDVLWVREAVQSEEFIGKLQIYGNFMHGTHVAGIAIKDLEQSEILAVKLIPTEVKLPAENESLLRAQLVSSGNVIDDAEGEPDDEGLGVYFVKKGLEQLAKMQMAQLTEIAAYVDFHHARVANGSFGTGYPQAQMITQLVFENLLRRAPTAAEMKEVADHFMSSLISEGKNMVDAAKNTLFVFAAGNDGLDNDEYGSSPTNIQSDNVLSVAATVDFFDLAPFSNYGLTQVDVAAPGVGIYSAVPGDHYLMVSGTSQAAPYVANVAMKVLAINQKLTSLEVKTIIKETVDVRDFLVGKVVTSGMVNSERAEAAARNSLTKNLSEAIALAKATVADPIKDKLIFPMATQYIKGLVPALPGQFILR